MINVDRYLVSIRSIKGFIQKNMGTRHLTPISNHQLEQELVLLGKRNCHYCVHDSDSNTKNVLGNTACIYHTVLHSGVFVIA